MESFVILLHFNKLLREQQIYIHHQPQKPLASRKETICMKISGNNLNISKKESSRAAKIITYYHRHGSTEIFLSVSLILQSNLGQGESGLRVATSLEWGNGKVNLQFRKANSMLTLQTR